MRASWWVGLLTGLLVFGGVTGQAAELTGRVAVAGVAAHASDGDVGRAEAGKTLTANQQNVRLMLDHFAAAEEWSVHLEMKRLQSNGFRTETDGGYHPFRRHRLGGSVTNSESASHSSWIGYEFDRAVYRWQGKTATLGFGRQPLDWGAGRFWQPLNVFGAFAPTDLNTEFKPGIDAVTVDWYPSPFSSLTGVFALSPHDATFPQGSMAVHYRGSVGTQSEMSLLGGRIMGHDVTGGSFESVWGGAGWRVETAYYWLDHTPQNAWFTIAGMDYQLADGTVLAAEWYRNTSGVTTPKELAGRADDPREPVGLRQQLGRDVFGVIMERQLTPLLHGSYLLLAAPLQNDDGKSQLSTAHQLNLTYSLSDESDLLMSVFGASGAGMNAADQPRSEFGHQPLGVTLRVRLYF